MTVEEKRRNFSSGIILAILSIGYIIHASQYPWGSLANPGPGFFPSILGAVLLILCVRLALLALPRGTERVNSGEASAQPQETRGGERRPRAVLALIVFVVYIALLPWIGFLISTVFLMLSIIKIAGERSWLKPLVVALGVGIFSYFLFVEWLQVPLPRGQLVSILGR